MSDAHSPDTDRLDDLYLTASREALRREPDDFLDWAARSLPRRFADLAPGGGDADETSRHFRHWARQLCRAFGRRRRRIASALAARALDQC